MIEKQRKSLFKKILTDCFGSDIMDEGLDTIVDAFQSGLPTESESGLNNEVCFGPCLGRMFRENDQDNVGPLHKPRNDLANNIDSADSLAKRDSSRMVKTRVFLEIR